MQFSFLDLHGHMNLVSNKKENQNFFINGDYIELGDLKRYVLDVPASSCESGCEIITYPNYGTDNQRWKIRNFCETLIIKNKVPRPAAYATVWWKFKCSSSDDWSQFQLKNSCVVEKTHSSTYYALLGFHGESFEGMADGGRGSGGYGGVQVKETERTLLIFSLWDGPVVKTKSIRKDFLNHSFADSLVSSMVENGRCQNGRCC